MVFKSIIGATCTALAVISFSADAALVSRLGGQAYYDTMLDVTWLADANLAASNTFGTGGVDGLGQMTWDTANIWISNMNASNGGLGYLGFNDWRLPTLGPIDGVSLNLLNANDGSSDSGLNMSRPGTVYGGSIASEMAHLFYNTLGNVSDYNVSGTFVDACPGNFVSCLVNTGPFSNLQSGIYWSGLEHDSNYVWMFDFDDGFQQRHNKAFSDYAWAVRTGDVAAVPVPAAVWLFGSGLLGLVGMARRKAG